MSQVLRVALRKNAPPAVCVAFSGGPDSTALLHALAQLPEARTHGLRALHVDHGLHAHSADWARHCAEFCSGLDLPLTVVRVDVDDPDGEGIEAAARRARYTAFAEHLNRGEWLALAHHRDDQVETVLLKLLRGAGPEGLGGMRALRPFAGGFLWRPILEITRGTLCNYLLNNDLISVSDPANDNPRFSRNVLRAKILPQIRQHWPHADRNILHAARLCRIDARYINRHVMAAFTELRRAAGTLDAGGWSALDGALRAPVLDAWLRARGLHVPPDAARKELQHQTESAAQDRIPVVTWHGAQVRVWDGRLHASPLLEPPSETWQGAWDGTPLVLPNACGTLTLRRTSDGQPPAPDVHLDPALSVRFRRGGERIRPASDPHVRELRKLFQRARIAPWLRTRCPLLYEDDELVAVADLWASARGRATFDKCGIRPHWQRPAWAGAMERW